MAGPKLPKNNYLDILYDLFRHKHMYMYSSAFILRNSITIFVIETFILFLHPHLNHDGEGLIWPIKKKLLLQKLATVWSVIFSLRLSAKKIVFWLWQKFTLIMTGGGQNDLTKNAITQNAQLCLKVICFGLLCFYFSPYNCKLCILALTKIQTNHDGRG